MKCNIKMKIALYEITRTTKTRQSKRACWDLGADPTCEQSRAYLTQHLERFAKK